MDDPDSDIASWEGVTGKDGRVIGLALDARYLTDILPDIGDLSKLTELNLSENQFSSVPQKVCDLGEFIVANGGDYEIDDNVECVEDPGN